MKLLVRSIAATGFFRCGAFFPPEGRIVDQGDFSEAQWSILQSEPGLHIGRAPEAVAAQAADLKALIRQTIGALDNADFGEDGAPKVEAIRAALPEVPRGITKKLVSEVWAELRPKE